MATPDDEGNGSGNEQYRRDDDKPDAALVAVDERQVARERGRTNAVGRERLTA